MNEEKQNSNNSNTNNNLTPNFENLSYGTLRRYQGYFNLIKEEGSIGKDKNEVLKMIKNHFNKLEVDPEKVVENFMRIEKDQNNEKNKLNFFAKKI